MKRHVITLVTGLLVQPLVAQGVGIGTSTPHPSAILELSSTTKGLLIPRLTEAERQALPDPATGLLIFNTTTGELNFYNGSSWRRIPSNAVSAASGTGTPSGEGVGIDASGGIGIPDPSAILDVKATDKGVLIPRTTPAAIPGPVAGLTIYNTSTNLLNYFDGTSWREPCGVLVDNNKGIGAVAGSGVAINTTGDPPHPSARLDVTHTSKGLLLPRLTSAQRDAVINPAVGLIIFNTTEGRIEYWRGNQWMRLMELPMQPSTITGPTSVCPGTSNVSYSVTNVPGISYDWSYSGSGFTITSGAGTHAITGNFSASATSGTLTVTPSNACGNGPAQSVSVTVDPNSTAPTNVSADHSTICEGQSTTLRASGGTAGTGSSLVWYAGGCGGGATQVGTGSSITVRPTSTTTYFVRREGGCGTPTSCASVTVTVNTNSTAPTNVSANPSTICAGRSTTLSASGGTDGTGSQLVWYTGSCGGTYVNTGSSITVSPNSTTTYYVRREAEGCAPTTCASATVTVNNVPGPGTISGPTTLCRGQSYNFSTTNNATSYNWYTTGAPEITFSGNGQHSVTVNVGLLGTTSSTTICVTPSNGSCSGSNRCQSVNIVAPPSVGPISGPTAICLGKTGVVFSVPNQPGVTYTWSYSGNGFTIVNGQGTHSIIANFSTAATSGQLTVTASNGSCSASSSINIRIRTARWNLWVYYCGGQLLACPWDLSPSPPPPSHPCTGDIVGETHPYHSCGPDTPPYFRECLGTWTCVCDP